MNTSPSSIKACISGAKSGNITPNSAALAVGVLGVTSDYLLEGAATEAAKARFEDHELLQQFQEVEKLPEDDKHVIKRLLVAFLTKKHLQALVR